MRTAAVISNLAFVVVIVGLLQDWNRQLLLAAAVMALVGSLLDLWYYRRSKRAGRPHLPT
jgi:Flp pilus assembly protein TadB